MSRSQRRRGRGALCERGASVCTESEGQERLDREQVTRDGVRWPVVMRRLRCVCHVSTDVARFAVAGVRMVYVVAV